MEAVPASPALVELLRAARSRALAGGVEANEYERIAETLESFDDWPSRFVLAAEGHLELAQIAERQGRLTSAGEAYLDAAACLHIATTVPSAAPKVHAQAADALRRALVYLDPGAAHLSGPSFAGVFRHPPGEPDAPLVVIVPGMDSSKVEFFAVSEALLRRGLATLCIDGPGQGELTTTSVPTLRYDHVVGEALDAVDAAGHRPPAVGLIALSLGGFYGATTLAHESRIVAGVIISGPSSLTWQLLHPQFS